MGRKCSGACTRSAHSPAAVCSSGKAGRSSGLEGAIQSGSSTVRPLSPFESASTALSGRCPARAARHPGFHPAPRRWPPHTGRHHQLAAERLVLALQAALARLLQQINGAHSASPLSERSACSSTSSWAARRVRSVSKRCAHPAASLRCVSSSAIWRRCACRHRRRSFGPLGLLAQPCLLFPTG
jgi:hypothetical protein